MNTRTLPAALAFLLSLLLGFGASSALATASVNIALNKTARQSSTYQGNAAYGAGKSVDGDASTFHHTNGEQGEWWEVDLGGYYSVSEIKILQGNCCNERLNNTDIMVSAYPLPAKSLNAAEIKAYKVGTITTGQSTNTIPASNAVGRYIRVQGWTYLHMAEVQVYGSSFSGTLPPPPVLPVNLALNKTAAQSSTYQSNAAYGAGKSVDGDTSTFPHTNGGQGDWWEVDLGANHALSEIVIRNGNCCNERLNNTDILVSGSPFPARPLTAAEVAAAKKGMIGTAQTVNTITLSNATGRYVRVQLQGWNYLHMAEVEVYGTASAAPPSPPAPVAATLSAHYKFDDTWGAGDALDDSSGNGKHATLTGAVAPESSPASGIKPATGKAGNVDKAGWFSTPALDIDTAAGGKNSVSFWMYWDGGFHSSNFTMPFSWGGVYYDLAISKYRSEMGNGAIGFNTGNGDIYGTSADGLANGWHHVAAVFNNGGTTQNKLYIDGVQKTLMSYGGQNSPSAAASAGIGAGAAWGGDYKWSGKLDNLKIYKGEITAAQIAADMAETAPAPVLPVNVALNKTARQSSTWDDSSANAASKAVDGNQGSWPHTKGGQSDWWEVDLGAYYKISEIKIFQGNCCNDRLNNTDVMVSAYPFPDGPLGAAEISAYKVGTITTGQSINTINASDAIGRYVRVQLQGWSYLHMAEVQVYGISYSGALPPKPDLLLVDDDKAQCPTAGSTTIAAALAAAKAGETITVCPGTYNGALAIGTSGLTIRGSTGNAADVKVNATGAGNAVFAINAASVTLKGMTLNNPDGFGVAGIDRPGPHTFENLVVSAGKFGFYLTGASNVATFKSVAVTTTSDMAIYLGDGSTGAHVLEGVTVIGGTWGIYAVKGVASLTNVNAEGKSNGGIAMGNAQATVFNNVTATSSGVYDHGIFISASDTTNHPYTFTKVTASGKNRGINIDRSGKVTMTDVTATTTGEYAIYLNTNADGAHVFDNVAATGPTGMSLQRGAASLKNVTATGTSGSAIWMGNKYAATLDTVTASAPNHRGIEIAASDAVDNEFTFTNVKVTAKSRGINVARSGKVKMNNITVNTPDVGIFLDAEAKGGHELTNLDLTAGNGAIIADGAAKIEDFKATTGIFIGTAQDVVIRRGLISSSIGMGIQINGTDKKKVTVEDVTISTGWQYGFMLMKASEALIQRVCISGMSTTGIYTTADNVTIRDSQFSSDGSSGGVMIDSAAAQKATVTNNAFLKPSNPRAGSNNTAHTFNGNYWQGVAGGTGYTNGNVADNKTLAVNPVTGCYPNMSPPLPPPQPAAILIADWRMDEPSWNGTAGEVKDSSGNNRHGKAVGTPMPTTLAGKVCGAATHPGPVSNGGAFEATGLPVSTTTGDKTTVAFWMYWDGTPDRMPIGFNGYDLYFGGAYLGFNTGNGGDVFGAPASGLANGWHHVTAIFTNGNVSANELYFDGIKQTLTQRDNQPRADAVVSSTLSIGGWPNNTYYRPTSSRIDEVKVWNGVLTAAQVAAGYANEAAGKNWDGLARTCAPVIPFLVDDDKKQCPTAGYTTVSAAVAAAKSGDTITICPGTYNEAVTLSGKSLAFVSSTNNKADVTISATSGAVITTDSPTTVKNLTLSSTTSAVNGINACPSSAATLVLTNVDINVTSGSAIFQNTSGNGCQGLALNLSNVNATSTGRDGIRVNNGAGTHVLNYMSITGNSNHYPLHINGGSGATLTDVDVTGVGDYQYSYLVNLQGMTGAVTFNTAQKGKVDITNTVGRTNGIYVAAAAGGTIPFSLSNVNVDVTETSIATGGGSGYGNHTLSATNVTTSARAVSGINLSNGAGNHVVNNATLYGKNGWGWPLTISGGGNITLTDVDATQFGTYPANYPAIGLSGFTGNLTVNTATKTGKRCPDIAGNANAHAGACIITLDAAGGTTSTNTNSGGLSVCNAPGATSQVNISGIYASGSMYGLSLAGTSNCGKYTANLQNLTAAVNSAYFRTTTATPDRIDNHYWAYPVSISNGVGNHVLTNVKAEGTYAYTGVTINGGGATLTDVQSTGLNSAVSITATGNVTLTNPTWAAANPYPATDPATFPIRGVSWPGGINGSGVAVKLATPSATTFTFQNTAVAGAGSGIAVNNSNGYEYPNAKLVMSNVSVNAAGGDGVALGYGTGQAHALSNVAVTATRTAMHLGRGTGSTLSNLNLTCGSDGATGGYGLSLESTSNLTLSGTNAITCKSPNSEGIHTFGCDTCTLSGAIIDMQSKAGTHGIYTDHNGPGSGWTIAGNTIKNAARHGIDMYGYPSAVTNNIVENSGTESGYYGIAMERGQGAAYNNCVYSPAGKDFSSATYLCAGSDSRCAPTATYPLANPKPSASAANEGNFWGSWPKGTGFSDTCADSNTDGLCDISNGGDYYPLKKCQLTSPGAPPPAGGGLVAEFRMDEPSWNGTAGEVLNSSGPLHGQAMLGATTAAGKICNAGSFAANYVQVADDPSLDITNNLTVSTWIKPARCGGASGKDYLMSFYSKDTDYEAHVTPECKINWWWGTGSITSSAAVQPNVWTHVAMVWKTGSQQLYINGVLSASGTVGGTLPVNDLPFQIGEDQGYNSGKRRFDGQIDELKIFNTAFTETQITSLYSNENAGKNWDGTTRTCAAPVAPVAEYRLDEPSWNGTAGEMKDSSGNGLHGRTISDRGAFTIPGDAGRVCGAPAWSGADGTKNGLLVPDNNLLDVQKVTMMAWVYPTRRDGWDYIVKKYGAYKMVMNASGQIIIEAGYGSNDETYRETSTGITLPLNAWSLVAATYDGRYTKTYVYKADGSLLASHSQDFGGEILLRNSINGLQIGPYSGWGSSDQYDGRVDEVKIFGSPLSAEQIAAIAANEAAGKNWDGTVRPCAAQAAPVADWHLDEPSWNGTAGEVKDSSASGFNGTAVKKAKAKASGKVCGYGRFNGNSYLDMGTPNLGLKNAVTVSAWVRWKIDPKVASAYSGKKDDDEDSDNDEPEVHWSWIAGNATSGCPDCGQFRLQHSFGNDAYEFGITRPDDSHPYVWSDSQQPPRKGVWQHVVGVYDGTAGVLRLYVDGALSGTRTGVTGDILPYRPNGTPLFNIGAAKDSRGRVFHGDIDEVKVWNSALTTDQIKAGYDNESAGKSWDGTDRNCGNPLPIAEYRMDESSWSGKEGEVVNSTGSYPGGRAVGGAGTLAGKVCNGGSFAGDRQYVQVDTTVSLKDFTYTAWVNDGNIGGGWRSIIDVDNDKQLLAANGSSYKLWGRCGNDISITTETSGWHHLTWTVSGKRYTVYVDGVAVKSGDDCSDDGVYGSHLMIGSGYGGNEYWKGLIDEVKLFDSALSATQVKSIYDNENAGKNWDGTDRTCPVYGPDHYELSLPSTSIACLPTTVTVTACKDATSPCTDKYVGVSGKTATLGASVGTLEATTVTFDANGVATTTLSHPSAANGTKVAVTLSGEQTAAANARKCCPDGTACVTQGSCETTFNTAGLIFSTSATGIAASPPTQISGKVSGTHYLRAVKTGTTTKACEAAVSGARNVGFAYTCVNPNSCTDAEMMEIGGKRFKAAGRSDISLTFDANGAAPFMLRYDDAGSIHLSASVYAANAVLLSGATPAPFVVKPAGLCVYSTQLSSCAAANHDCPVAKKVGETFNLTVAAVRDGADCASPDTYRTPNFRLANILLGSALVAPSAASGGVEGTVGKTSLDITANGWGATDQSISEVGVFKFSAAANGKYLDQDINISGLSGALGRFYPDHFAITPGASTPGCGIFTYLGQDGFSTAFTITAQNAVGATTQNYTGNFAKLGSPSWTALAFTASGLPAGSVLSEGGTPPSVGTWAKGSASVTAKHRASRPASPVNPATNVIVSAKPVDSDGVTLPASAAVNSTAAVLRFGRLWLGNAYGSDRAPLSIPYQAQYWNGSTFVKNTDDSCSTIASGSIGLGNYQGKIEGKIGTPTVSGMVGGQGNINIAAPSSPASGSVDLVVNLGATGTPGNCQSLTGGTSDNKAYLAGKWCGTAYDRNPAARATFGIFGSSSKRGTIYLRESY